MNLPQELWTALPVIAACATLTFVGLVLVRIIRKRRAHRQTASCEALRANLIAYIAAKSEDPIVEAALDRSGFVTVTLHLLTQIDGVSREQLVDLMPPHRRQATAPCAALVDASKAHCCGWRTSLLPVA
jgi:molybdopterin synthase catalytic subunit